MAQINITLSQEEFLALMAGNCNELFKTVMENGVNQVLKCQSDHQLQAKPYERNDDRTDYRNGYRERQLVTRIGTIVLHVPRHRFKPFETELFENYSRSESALIATMAEMVINGVSTRKIARITETLCGKTVSKSAVSNICRHLSEQVEKFRSRPLTKSYPFLTVDATYFKVREHHKIISKSLFIAYATSNEGHREIIGFKVYQTESAPNWEPANIKSSLFCKFL